MSTAPMRCVVERQTPSGLLRLSGTLDLAATAAVRAALLKCLAAQPEIIVVDVSGLAVVDEINLSVFPAMGRHAAAWPGTVLALAAPGPRLAAALKRMAVCRYVPTYPTVEQALASHRRATRADRVSERLPPRGGSLRAARALVDRACRAWGVAALSDDAQLVVNELVANAVLHAHTSPEVTVVLRQRHLHLSVRDGSGDGPRVVGGDEFGDGGRGLILVEALATAWGWTPTADGKVVWATLRLPGASPR